MKPEIIIQFSLTLESVLFSITLARLLFFWVESSASGISALFYLLCSLCFYFFGWRVQPLERDWVSILANHFLALVTYLSQGFLHIE